MEHTEIDLLMQILKWGYIAAILLFLAIAVYLGARKLLALGNKLDLLAAPREVGFKLFPIVTEKVLVNPRSLSFESGSEFMKTVELRNSTPESAFGVFVKITREDNRLLDAEHVRFIASKDDQ